MTSRSGAFLVILALSAGGLLTGQTLPASKPTPLQQTYGTSAVTYFGVPAAAFTPSNSDTHYSSGTFSAGKFAVDCLNLCFVAPLQLPGGAKIVYVELDYVDSSSTEIVLGSLRQCTVAGESCTLHPTAGAGPADCLTGGGLCSGQAFDLGQSTTTADLTGDGLTVDNFNNSYNLMGGACCTGDSKLGGMIVGYVLQVSPPPANADFADVPATHSYFQFIEALYASGVTAGCATAPLRYCPDRPITRGEMAVFLARALGLQFH